MLPLTVVIGVFSIVMTVLLHMDTVLLGSVLQHHPRMFIRFVFSINCKQEESELQADGCGRGGMECSSPAEGTLRGGWGGGGGTGRPAGQESFDDRSVAPSHSLAECALCAGL